MKAINPQKPFYSDTQQTSNNFSIQDQRRKRLQRICKFWVKDRCAYGDNCRFLHSWFQSGNGFSMLPRLEGHKRSVVGVAFPSGPDKLILAVEVELSGFGITTLESSWVFIGLPNLVRVWNLSSEGNKEFSLDGPIGQVYALAVYKDLLFAGTANGSMDNTVKVWDLETAVQANSKWSQGCGDVTSELGSVLTDMLDAKGKPIVFCSCNDNCVRLFELNSFTEMDRIFAEQEVREIQRGPNGLFFTGDAAGVVTVWMWHA
ncbi:zinc finger CCCH domain-containing protein 48-like [Hevea brasiliensis]|uniref:zinc finger CCCH domain-containing protein 48-like n=1 Tax=Hevea brasiliensis TaxID=3981 RepID=UPI0025CD7F9A|nr:zinc finger CCCH domain-containing protein 48-like [Hevea brasiliensis]